MNPKVVLAVLLAGVATTLGFTLQPSSPVPAALDTSGSALSDSLTTQAPQTTGGGDNVEFPTTTTAGGSTLPSTTTTAAAQAGQYQYTVPGPQGPAQVTSSFPQGVPVGPGATTGVPGGYQSHGFIPAP